MSNYPTPSKDRPTKVHIRCLRDGRTQTHNDDGYTVLTISGRVTYRANTGRSKLLRALIEVVDPKTQHPLWALAETPLQAPAAPGDPLFSCKLYDDPRYAKAIEEYQGTRERMNEAGEGFARAEAAKREAEQQAQANATAGAVAAALDARDARKAETENAELRAQIAKLEAAAKPARAKAAK